MPQALQLIFNPISSALSMKKLSFSFLYRIKITIKRIKDVPSPSCPIMSVIRYGLIGVGNSNVENWFEMLDAWFDYTDINYPSDLWSGIRPYGGVNGYEW